MLQHTHTHILTRIPYDYARMPFVKHTPPASETLPLPPTKVTSYIWRKTFLVVARFLFASRRG